MPPIFELPTAVETRRINKVRSDQMAKSSVIFGYFPDEFSKDTVLRWVQGDSTVGMQQIRGINGKPPSVAMLGDNVFLTTPGYFGEFIPLDERTLTERRDAAVLQGSPVSLADLIAKADAQLETRYWALKAYVLWQLALYGTFSVVDKTGTISFKGSFTPLTFAPIVPWSTTATAIPIKDLQVISQLNFGQSVDMNDAPLYLNSLDIFNLTNNTNAADLGGKLLQYGRKVASLEDVNEILSGYGVPRIVRNDETYVAENGTVTRFVTTGRGVVFGRRTDGEQIGAYRHTNNLNSEAGDPDGTYAKTEYNPEQVPIEVKRHRGHNGGPVLFFPGCIVTLTGL